jgi:hypothetical protein
MKIALFALAALIGLVVMYPGKLKSWANSTQEAASSSIST